MERAQPSGVGPVSAAMADFLGKRARSALMSRVKGRDTLPERRVRRAVWRSGFRYRLNDRKLPGTPDLVFHKYGTVVLVQGCFWHGHDCPKGRRPTSNREFWNRKLDDNVVRDAANHSRLKELGWEVFLIWECNLSLGTEDLLAHLRKLRSTSSQE